MNALQQAAIELRLDDLKSKIRRDGDLAGTLLAASSAHDPDTADKNGKIPMEYVKNAEMKDVFREHGAE